MATEGLCTMLYTDGYMVPTCQLSGVVPGGSNCQLGSTWYNKHQQPVKILMAYTESYG
jgi:hypothetical protein